MSISFSTLCCGIVILLLLQHTKSFSLRRIFGPSSTQHLADLLELYDILEDPTFLESSEEWNTAFRGIFESVKATSEGAVEGKGLIATRDFSEGEVVSLYPYVPNCVFPLHNLFVATHEILYDFSSNLTIVLNTAATTNPQKQNPCARLF